MATKTGRPKTYRGGKTISGHTKLAGKAAKAPTSSRPKAYAGGKSITPKAVVTAGVKATKSTAGGKVYPSRYGGAPGVGKGRKSTRGAKGVSGSGAAGAVS